MNKNKGFTLIELLVVIAIIGIIATLAFISLNTARQRTRDSKRWADIRAMQSALEICINEGGSPPDATPATSWNNILDQTCASGEKFGTYFATNSLPMPPQAATCENGPAGDCYLYCEANNKYVLYSDYEGSAPAGGLNGIITNYIPANDCMLSNNNRPTGLPTCNPIDGGTFCLGNL